MKIKTIQSEFVTITKERMTLFKKVHTLDGKPIVLQLYVPKNVRIYSPYPKASHIDDRKVRVDECTPVAAYNLNGTPSNQIIFRSMYKSNFYYELGQRIIESDFDTHSVTCTEGIHAFFNPEDAVRYTL